MGRYDIIATYTVEEILPQTGNGLATLKCSVGEVDYYPSLYSLRFETFKRDECTCIKCGRVGTIMGLDLPRGQDSPHFNLYCIENKKMILMTKDHIIPKSKGGPDTLDNLQTMCGPCNFRKGNGDPIGIKEELPLIEEYMGLTVGTTFDCYRAYWRILNFKPDNPKNQVLLKRIPSWSKRHRGYKSTKSVSWVKDAIKRVEHVEAMKKLHGSVEEPREVAVA